LRAKKGFRGALSGRKDCLERKGPPTKKRGSGESQRAAFILGGGRLTLRGGKQNLVSGGGKKVGPMGLSKRPGGEIFCYLAQKTLRKDPP